MVPFCVLPVVVVTRVPPATNLNFFWKVPKFGTCCGVSQLRRCCVSHGIVVVVVVYQIKATVVERCCEVTMIGKQFNNIWKSLCFFRVAVYALNYNVVFGFSLSDKSNALSRTLASLRLARNVSSRRGVSMPNTALLVVAPSSSESIPTSSAELEQTTGRNADIFEGFVNGLWKGITLPFPSLRGLAKARKRSNQKKELLVGWSVNECLLAIAGYLTIGVVAYSYIFEQWSILDSLYFSCVCFSTVGYGDLSPKSLGGRLFTCFFGLGGIVFLGTAVATIASHVVQAELEAAHVARQVSRQRVMQFIDHRLPHFLKDLAHLNHHHNGTNVEHHLPHLFPMLSNATSPGWLSRGGTVVKRFLPSLGLVALGGIWIGRLSGWDWMDSIYFAVVTASTIGLGDLAPSTPMARLLAIFFIPLSVAAAGELLSSVATTLVQRRQKAIFHTLMERDLTMHHLQAMDLDHSGKVTREEYVQFMLLEMGHVSMEEIKELQAQFERLDVTKSGFLDQSDLKLLADLRKKNATR